MNNVTTLSGYHDTIFKKILHEIKFNNNKRLATLMGKLLHDRLSIVPYLNAVWIPIPQHQKRINERGFNPLELLFLPVLRKNNINSNPLLQRLIHTPQLHDYTRSQRFEIMKGAMGFSPLFSPDLIMNQHIVIYDDIYTTGATIETVYQRLLPYNITRCDYVTLTVTQ